MSEQTVIALDLGGTLLRTGVVQAPREIVHQATHRVGGRRGNAEIDALLRIALLDTLAWARSTGTPVTAVGLAVPGLVDPVRGVIRYSANLEVRDMPVGAIAHAISTCPVVVENDVRAAAWAEWTWGAGRGTRYMAYLSAGTGIAAALVVDGTLYHGANAAAGELGHVPVVPDGERCRCGHHGCLETMAGGWGIARRAERMAAARPSVLADSAAEGGLTTEPVFAAASAGDAVATAIMAEAGDFLGRAAVALVRLWNPERLVLGGGLFFDGSPLTAVVQRAVAASPLYGDQPPPVLLAEFGGSSGLIGAAGLAFRAEQPTSP